jgi:membrane-associated phospholipid phosphatase
LVTIVAFSRVYLGVHYLSDVLAAAAAGVTSLTFCLVFVDTLLPFVSVRSSGIAAIFGAQAQHSAGVGLDNIPTGW